MIGRRTRRAALICATLALAGCGAEESTGPGPVTRVTLSPAEDTLSALGATLQFRAVAQDARGDTIPQSFAWRSSAPNVVSVTDSGLATAHRTGAATITAIAFTGQMDTAHIVVIQTLATIAVAPESIRGVGATSPPFQAVGRDSNDSTIPGVMFTWSSADTSVATIATDGVATARRLGTTTIRAAAVGVTGEGVLTVNAHYYVNAGFGDDLGPGTSAAVPFRTITRALSVAAAGNSIKVFPGVYINQPTGGGEVFPLRGPAGVILVGDEPNSGGGPALTFVGRRSVSSPGIVLWEPPVNAQVSGFTISDSALNVTMNIVNPGIRFRNNRILRARDGGLNVVVSTGSITDNLISGGAIGLRLCGGGPNLQFEGNTFTGNSIGISADCPGAAVNGGATASRANVISCNNLDVYVQSGIAFSAVNNRWDHAPPTMGVDIVFVDASASVVTTGATLAPSPCP